MRYIIRACLVNTTIVCVAAIVVLDLYLTKGSNKCSFS